MDTSSYSSQQEAITRRAKEKGIPLEDLNSVFDGKIDAIVQEHPGTLPGWRLGRAEYLVWEHFFPDEPFPDSLRPLGGVKNSESPAKADMKSQVFQNTDNYRPMDKMAITGEWVHDKYQAESPRRKGDIIESLKSDYYNGPAARLTDSYKPSPRNKDNHRVDSRDVGSYRPSSQGSKNREPEPKSVAYASQADMMFRKALRRGYTEYQYNLVRYKCKEEVGLDHNDGTFSSQWRQWREEKKIWRHFCMDPTNAFELTLNAPCVVDREPFPGIEPRVTNYRSSESSTRPRTFADGTTMTMEGSCQSASSGNLAKPSYVSQAQLIDLKARSLNVPQVQVQASYEEKVKLVKQRFVNESDEWQLYFVESSVWGSLFKDSPFPGQEPCRDYPLHSESIKSSLDQVSHVAEFAYSTQEKLMEEMAKAKRIRREFFQFLNNMRHDAIAKWPECSCYAKAWMADTTTWERFFKEPFPVTRPPTVHGPNCKHAHMQYRASNSQAITQGSRGQSVMTLSKLSGGNHEAVVGLRLGGPSPVKTLGHYESLPSAQVCVKSQLLPALSSSRPPGAQSSVVARNAGPNLPNKFHPAPSPLRSRTIQSLEPAQSSSEAQKLNPQAASGQPCLPAGHNQSLTSTTVQTQPINSRPGPGNIFQLQDQEVLENLPPASILISLGEMRKARQIPEGSIVMQNMEATICDSNSVAQMLRCLQSEGPTSIETINNGLKCYFRYKSRLNGDLLLWIEPFTPEDTSAFPGGHLFLRGWVQRNLGFGIVQPSYYWNEIRITASFMQVATTPTRACEALSPAKSDRGSDTWGQKAEVSVKDAVLVVRGEYVESLPCSRTALKNLAFSFIIDSCKDRVEQRLRCTFSLTESEGRNKHSGRGIEIVVKPLQGNDKDGFKKATQFVRAWALHAIQSTPCKASSFLVSPEGLSILGKVSSDTPANGESGKCSTDSEKSQGQKSPFSASDLDRMLAEEAAKAEGPSRLVLDEVTGLVITVRELLKRTLCRASAKILGSSVLAEAEDTEDDDDDDEYIKITGTDGHMKDMGGGSFVVVDNSELPGAVNGKREVGEDKIAGEGAEKRVCTGVDGEKEAEKAREIVDKTENMASVGADIEMGEIIVDGGAEEVGIVGPAAIPLKNDPGVIETSEPANGKRKAGGDEGADWPEKKVCF